MKLRQSGMPEEAYWETLLDVPLILDRLQVDSSLRDVSELGCGYGTFSLPLAERISGTLHTYDVDPEMVRRTALRAAAAQLKNIVCEQRDVFASGFGTAPGSQDACLLFNILHCEEPLRLLRDALHVVRPNGLILVIHWRFDPATPRGPSMDIRPRPEQIVQWGLQCGLRVRENPILDLPPWHYGIRFQRPIAAEETP